MGTSIKDDGRPVRIVGIFKDVHYESLYKELRPMGLWTSAKGSYRRTLPERYAYIKVAAGTDLREPIERIREVAAELILGYPVDIQPLDTTLRELYGKSRRQGWLIAGLCGMAILLSPVGVFGLVILETQGREKEIAIRKVFGATIRQILWRLNASYLRVTLISFPLSIPLAYGGAALWLRGFAYRTPIHPWVFVASLAIMVVLVIATVTAQSYQKASSNPAERLNR